MESDGKEDIRKTNREEHMGQKKMQMEEGVTFVTGQVCLGQIGKS